MKYTLKMFKDRMNEFYEGEAEIIHNPEEVYWHPIFKNSVAHSEKIDIRSNYRRKPVIIELEDRGIIIEYDYNHNNSWIIHNTRGDILGNIKTKYEALKKAYKYLAFGERI